MLATFADADNLGSLITPDGFDAVKLSAQLDEIAADMPVFASEVATLREIVRQAELLSQKYWVVVANPPYMGSKGMNPAIKEFADREYPNSKSDLFAMFIETIDRLTMPESAIGLLTPFVWLFLSSYEKFRSELLDKFTITSLTQLEYNAFEPACIPVCTFTLKKPGNKKELGTYIKLSDFKGHQNQEPKLLEAIANPDCGYLYYAKAADFAKIPGSPISYSVGERELQVFIEGKPLSEYALPRAGMITGNNDLFIRYWFEVHNTNIGLNFTNRLDAQKSTLKWFPLLKGGSFRRWYGNYEYVVDWENDGEFMRTKEDENGKIPAHAFNDNFIFKSNLNWSAISSSNFSIRVTEKGFLFGSGGYAVFPENQDLYSLAGLMNSTISAAPT